MTPIVSLPTIAVCGGQWWIFLPVRLAFEKENKKKKISEDPNACNPDWLHALVKGTNFSLVFETYSSRIRKMTASQFWYKKENGLQRLVKFEDIFSIQAAVSEIKAN